MNAGSEGRAPDSVVISAKMRPPDLPPGVVERRRLVSMLARPSRIALVAAPPGYGKTVLIRQHIDAEPRPVVWLSFDLFDQSPTSFWLHLLRAVRDVVDEVDDEAEQVLREDQRSQRFLAVLIDQIDRAATPFTLVIDDIAPWASRSIHEGIELLVERVGHLVRIVMSARADPPLPLARWRANAWLVDIREDDLRLTDHEACEAAATFERPVARDTVVALNRHVDGWPIGLHLALVSGHDAADPEASARALVRSDRLLADYVVAEVLDALPVRHREVALILSVVPWFDAEICRRLAGDDASEVVVDLERRRLVITSTGSSPDGKRFHRVFRELLETELRWRDPRQHVEAHRAAAAIWLERGVLNSSYRHLVAAHDFDAANGIILEPMIDLVDRSDRLGLAMAAGSFHAPAEVDQPGLALDLATAWFFAGSEIDADMWCARAASLIDGIDALGSAGLAAARRRLCAVRCLLATFHGDLETAAECLAAFEQHDGSAEMAAPIEHRFPTVAARVALGRGDLDEARRWLASAASYDAPAAAATVLLSSLNAWFELLSGRLSRANELARGALAAAEHGVARPHHGVLEALLIGARTRLAGGDLAEASELAALARADAAELGFDWNRARAGLVSAETRGLLEGPQTAVAVVRDVRSSLYGDVDEVHSALDIAEARALGRLGHLDAAWSLLSRAGDSVPALLARAGLHLDGNQLTEVQPLLVDADGWDAAERYEAHVLGAAADATGSAGARMRDVVELAATDGWVSPFLGHGPRVDLLLRQQPLEWIHPALAVHCLPYTDGAHGDGGPIEPLTAREVTILELLPSHRSYSQIGDSLHLSVNTVKSNVKSIYRKLGVNNRSDAVDSARQARLL